MRLVLCANGMDLASFKMVATTVSSMRQGGPDWRSQLSAPPHHPPEDSCVTTTFHYLQASGWYWGAISANEAQDALLTSAEGTFFVRDSSHPQYMFTLSVKTCCGPTSVRIKNNRDSFWLESLSSAHCKLFPNVLCLIQHYAEDKTQGYGTNTKIQAEHFEETSNNRGVTLKLRRPLHRPNIFPSLQHLTRLTINRHTSRQDLLPLPVPLLHYLQEYPFYI